MKKIFLSLLFLLVISPVLFAGDIKGGGVQNSDLVKLLGNLRIRSNNCVYGSVGLGQSTAATQNLKTTTTQNYTINGIFYSRIPTLNVGFTTTAQQAVSKHCKYLVSLNTSGIFTVTKGQDSTSTLNAQLPAFQTSKCPIGYILIQTNGSTTFTGGTTKLSATGITATYYNMGSMVTGINGVRLEDL